MKLIEETGVECLVLITWSVKGCALSMNDLLNEVRVVHL